MIFINMITYMRGSLKQHKIYDFYKHGNSQSWFTKAT